MNENTDPNMYTIENATADDIQYGDRVARKHTWESRGFTCTDIREGVAHHLDEDGDWFTVEGAWLMGPNAVDYTVTIRRPIVDLPKGNGARIEASNKFIEAEVYGEKYRTREAILSDGHWWGAWVKVEGDGFLLAVPEWQIIPGTWKVVAE